MNSGLTGSLASAPLRANSFRRKGKVAKFADAITQSQNTDATTAVYGLATETLSLAISGNQKWSPAIKLSAAGYGTTAGTSQDVSFDFGVRPIQGTVPTGVWALRSSIAGGGWTDTLRIWTQNTLSMGATGGVGSWGVSGSSVTLTLGRIGTTGVCDGGTEIVDWRSNDNGLAVRGVLSIGTSYASRDCYILRKAAANLCQGAADAASPVAQTFSVQSATGTNVAGANRTISGSQSTGDQEGGDIIFTVSSPGASGASQNSLTATLTLHGDSAKTAQFAGAVVMEQATAYAVLCGGTSTTTPLQSVASVGSTGQVLTSNGAGALPTWEDTSISGGSPSYLLEATSSGHEWAPPIRGHIHALRVAHGVSLWQSAVSGAGTYSAGSGYGKFISSGATNGTARVAWNNGAVNNSGYTFHRVSGLDNRSIPWTRKVEVCIAIQLSAWSATTNGYARLYFGVGPQIGTVLADKGIGVHIDAARSIYLVAYDGTSLATSASLGTFPLTGTNYYVHFRLCSDGAGNVSLYKDEVLIGSITGGPTANGAQNKCGMHFEVSNGGDAATNTLWLGDFTIGVI